MTSAVDRACQEGFGAKAAGVPFTDNPFPMGSHKAEAWEAGYQLQALPPVKTCEVCGTGIDKRSTRCRRCSAKNVSLRPETREANRRRISRPDVRAKMAETRFRPEVRERVSASQRAARLRHIHEDYRDLYMSLKGKANAAERLAMVHDQMRKDGVSA